MIKAISHDNVFIYLNYKLLQFEFHLFAALFILGNLLLPLLVHLVPRGGQILLPIYFFTLVGTYKFGWRMGLVIASFSPLLNNLLIGLPAGAMLTVTMVKSFLLVLFTVIYSKRIKKLSLLNILAIILSYQFFGALAEYLIAADAAKILSGLLISLPGLALQLFGGYFILNKLNDYGEKKSGGDNFQN